MHENKHPHCILQRGYVCATNNVSVSCEVSHARPAGQSNTPGCGRQPLYCCRLGKTGNKNHTDYDESQVQMQGRELPHCRQGKVLSNQEVL